MRTGRFPGLSNFQMSDNIDSTAGALIPAQTEPAETASATPDQMPEVVVDENANPDDQQIDERKFSQAEMDEAIQKRLARERRKWDRQQAQNAVRSQQQQAPNVNVGTVDQYESVEAYAKAYADAVLRDEVAKRESAKSQDETLGKYHEKEEEVRDKYTDFDQVVHNPSLTISNTMASAIVSSDIGPEIAYFLGSNPKEAARIAKLSDVQQAKEIGKIEAKLAENPPVKKTTSAPPPIRPIGAKATTNATFDTTDPRSVKSMSTSQWIEAERQRQIKKAQSR